MKFEVRQDREGNVYELPEVVAIDFDIDADEAVRSEPDEAIGLWIDIKTKYKRYLMQDE